jgi:hypothetical protein
MIRYALSSGVLLFCTLLLAFRLNTRLYHILCSVDISSFLLLCILYIGTIICLFLVIGQH